MQTHTPPIILCFSGLDPTGGAGIQADIEAIGQHGGHAAPIITANTVQDTKNVNYFEAIAPGIILQQAQSILMDMPVSAIKIGMLGSSDTAEAIHIILKQNSHIPVIFDPVLYAGGGSSLSKSDLIDAIKRLIIPHTHILTPNIPEAHHLTSDTLTSEHAAQKLNSLGAEHVLLTGTHAKSENVIHELYSDRQCIKSFKYKRLSHEYHGSGCTLAASLAALTAKQTDLVQACQTALDYTYKSLKNAQSLGHGQLIPKRYS